MESVNELSIERKYELEKIVREYFERCEKPDFNDLLEDTYGQTMLDKEDINYLYLAFYLPYDKLEVYAFLFNNGTIDDRRLCIEEIKNNYLDNIKKHGYSSMIKDRLRDIGEVSSYEGVLVRGKKFKSYKENK